MRAIDFQVARVKLECQCDMLATVAVAGQCHQTGQWDIELARGDLSKRCLSRRLRRWDKADAGSGAHTRLITELKEVAPSADRIWSFGGENFLKLARPVGGES